MSLLGIDGISEQLQKTIEDAMKNFVPPGDLVQQVTQGPGTASLQTAHDTGVAQTDEQRRIEDDSRKMMANLEAAWSGPASGNARSQVEPLALSADSASQALHQNSAIVADQVHSFEQLKNSLHTEVSNKPPETSTWDDITPWDTDTEDQINARNDKVDQNLKQFKAYTETSDSNIPQLSTNYGQLNEMPDGGFQIEKKDVPGDHATGLVNFDEKNDSTSAQGTGGSSSATPGGSGAASGGGSAGGPGPGGSSHGGSVNTPQSPGGASNSPGNPQHAGSITPPAAAGNNQTKAASYTPPNMRQPGSASYQPPAFGPSGGSSSSYQSPALGGVSAGSFGPTGGSTSGGSGVGRVGTGGGAGGGSAAGGGQGLGGGKATGSGMPSESAARGGPTAGGATGGGQGRGGGMAGMGGAGRGGGQGGDDEEHQRPSFLVEADPQNIFGSDEKTAPPVIGE